MIEINLLPGSRKKKKSAATTSVDFAALLAGLNARTRDKFLLGAIAAVIAAGAAGAYLYWSQTQLDATLHARLEKAQKDSTHYATLLGDRRHSEALRDTLLRQVNLIKSLDGDRYVWPHVMEEVSRVLPQYTWLTAVTFGGTQQGTANVVALPKSATPEDTTKKKSAPKRIDTNIPKEPITLRISGQTVDIEAIPRFMRDLEASPFLENVQLERSELATVQQKEVHQFQLLMTYTRDTTTIHRVPFSVAGR